VDAGSQLDEKYGEITDEPVWRLIPATAVV
jgi:hypothetical protein